MRTSAKLTLIRQGRRRQFDPPCGFSKTVSSKEKVKLWFFVTFSIILKDIFPENFIEFLKSFRRYEEIFCQY